MSNTTAPTKEKLDELREKILPVLMPYGVKRVALFGSIMHGTERPDSDIDVLVAFKEPIGLVRLAHAQRDLETRLARRVDLVTEGALSLYIRPFVDQEKMVIYEE